MSKLEYHVHKYLYLLVSENEVHISNARGGGSNARLGGRKLTLLCGFNQYTLLQNRDNTGLLGTPVYCSLKLGGRCPPNAQVGGAAAPPAPPVEPPLNAEEVGQWLICACVGKLRIAIIFFSKVKRGQGEQLQAAISGLCEGQRSVLSSSVDRAELAILCQLFRFT